MRLQKLCMLSSSSSFLFATMTDVKAVIKFTDLIQMELHLATLQSAPLVLSRGLRCKTSVPFSSPHIWRNSCFSPGFRASCSLFNWVKRNHLSSAVLGPVL